MAGSKYQLSLRAELEKGTLKSAIDKEVKALEALGATDIKIRTTVDKTSVKGMEVATKGVVNYTDATGNANRANIGFGRSIDGTTADVKVLNTATTGATKSTNYFAKGMLQSAKTAAQYALSIGLIYKALAELGDGVQYIKDLDKEMRNIQIVAGYTDEQIESLAGNFNDLAKSMGVTTLAVAQGSLEWTRQGKSIAETQELLESTMMMSKLGNVESAEATEYLTSILNGFKLEAEDSVGVVDKLIAIDNAAATSVQELAIAFQKSAVSAGFAGVEFSTLAAWIGTVSSVTRLSSETIGTALNF